MGGRVVFNGLDAELARRVWLKTAQPCDEVSVFEDLIAIDVDAATVRTVVENLVGAGVLIVLDVKERKLNQEHDTSTDLPCERLLVCMTGTIQCAIFTPYLFALRQAFCKEMRIVLTESATKMVNPKTLQHLFNCDVHTNIFEEMNSGKSVPHIWLSEWARCILVAPSTAATIHRIATASCDDLTSLIVTAVPQSVPVILGPSMNEWMWKNQAVQANVDSCRKRGIWVIEPGLGVEVNRSWGNRVARIGALGTQPKELVEILKFIVSDPLTSELGQNP